MLIVETIKAAVKEAEIKTGIYTLFTSTVASHTDVLRLATRSFPREAM